MFVLSDSGEEASKQVLAALGDHRVDAAVDFVSLPSTIETIFHTLALVTVFYFHYIYSFSNLLQKACSTIYGI